MTMLTLKFGLSLGFALTSTCIICYRIIVPTFKLQDSQKEMFLLLPICISETIDDVMTCSGLIFVAIGTMKRTVLLLIATRC